MALTDDVKKILKNQQAMQRELAKLSKRVTALEVDEDEVIIPEDDEIEESQTTPEPEINEPKKPTAPPIENLGFKIFGSVAFLLLLIGFFSLYRYAVAQQWIGILGRVALGVILSLGVILTGEYLKKKYAKFSQLLTGGGLALLYFTIYATYAFEEYRTELGMTLPLNAALLFAIVIVAVILALRYDSQLLACYAFLLGYLSALLANVAGNPHLSIVSGIILSIGMITLLHKKEWHLALFPFLGSWLIYAIVYGTSKLGGTTWPMMATSLIIYSIILFLLFTYMTFLLKDSKDNTINVIISVLNAALFFGFILNIIHNHVNELRGLFPVLLAGFYLVMTKQAKTRELNNLYQAFFVLCITFLTSAIPLQFEGFIVTSLWAVEGFLLIEIGLRAKHSGIRGLGYFILAMAALQTLTNTLYHNILWERLLNAIIVIGALFASTIRMLNFEEQTTDNDTFMRRLFFIAGVGALTLLLAVESYADSGIFGYLSDDAAGLLLTILWSMEAYLLYRIGTDSERPIVTIVGSILAAIVLFKLLVVDVQIDSWTLRLPSMVIGFALLYIITIKENKATKQTAIYFGLATALLFTVSMAVEILDANGLIGFLSSSARQVILSIAWAVEAVALIAYGLKKDKNIIRTVGIVLFIITIAKILIKDLSVLEPIYRSIVSIIVGFITLGASFAYVKNKDKLEHKK